MRPLIPLGVGTRCPAALPAARRAGSRVGKRCAAGLLVPVFLLAEMQTQGMEALADVALQTMNGVPLLPVPTYEETGLPMFTMPTGTVLTGTGTSTDTGGSTGTGSSTDGSDSAAMAAMMRNSWGDAASQNAQTVGVTPAALAATCMLESNCSSSAPSHGTISGAFQMLDSTYAAMMSSALARDPTLVSTIVPGLAGKSDPATQSIAAAEYLRQGATYLQAHDIANPTSLDVRGYYNFGPGNGAAIAQSADSDLMSSRVTGLTDAQFRANGIIPGTTTVGQWRAGITQKIGASAASAPVLLVQQ